MGTVLKSSLINLAATLVSLMAGFAVSILNARLMGPEGSGLAAFALWFAASLSAMTDRGMPQILLRSLGAFTQDQHGQWKAVARTAFALFSRSVAAGALLVAAYSLWNWQAKGLERSLFWVATLALFVLYALASFSTAAARGRGNFREAAINTGIGSLVQLPFIVAGALLFGAAGAVAGMAIRFVPQALRLNRYVDFSTSPQRESLTPEMRRHARQMWLTDMIDVIIMTRVELLLLGLLFSTTEMGYFAVAVVFAGLVSQLALQLSPSLIVGFSNTDATDEQRRDLFGHAMRLSAIIVLPMGFGGAAVMPQLLPLVFGQAFIPAEPAAALLLVSAAIGGIAVVPWAYLAATGGSDSLLRIMVITAITTVCVISISIWTAGIYGAALARIFIEILTFALLMIMTMKRGGPSIPFAILFRTACAASLCALAAWLTALALPGWHGLAIAISVGALTYLAGIRLFGLVTERDANALLNINAFQRLPAPARRLMERGLRMIAKPA